MDKVPYKVSSQTTVYAQSALPPQLTRKRNILEFTKPTETPNPGSLLHFIKLLEAIKSKTIDIDFLNKEFLDPHTSPETKLQLNIRNIEIGYDNSVYISFFTLYDNIRIYEDKLEDIHISIHHKPGAINQTHITFKNIQIPLLYKLNENKKVKISFGTHTCKPNECMIEYAKIIKKQLDILKYPPIELHKIIDYYNKIIPALINMLEYILEKYTEPLEKEIVNRSYSKLDGGNKNKYYLKYIKYKQKYLNLINKLS